MDMPITTSPSQTRLITQTESHNNRDEATSLSCLNFFKKIWKPLLGSLLLIVGIPLIFTGLVGGSVITLSGFAGFLPGFLIGPVAGFILVGAGGTCVLLGLALLFGPSIMERLRGDDFVNDEEFDKSYEALKLKDADENPRPDLRRPSELEKIESFRERYGHFNFMDYIRSCFGCEEY